MRCSLSIQPATPLSREQVERALAAWFGMSEPEEPLALHAQVGRSTRCRAWLRPPLGPSGQRDRSRTEAVDLSFEIEEMRDVEATTRLCLDVAGALRVPLRRTDGSVLDAAGVTALVREAAGAARSARVIRVVGGAAALLVGVGCIQGVDLPGELHVRALRLGGVLLLVGLCLLIAGLLPPRRHAPS